MMNRTKISPLVVAATLLLGIVMQGCIKDKCDLTYTYMKYSPVYMSEAEFKAAVKVEAPRAVENPGKIYLKDSYLFVNEVGKGVHIFDNENPANPVALSYLNLPGNYEVTFHCDKMYADNSIDLVVFDMTNPAKPIEIERIENALPHMLEYRGYFADPSKGVVVSWEQEVKTEAYDCETGVPDLWQENQVDPSVVDNWDFQTGRTMNAAIPGKAGSMSRFTVKNDYVYVITPSQIEVYNDPNCGSPAHVGSVVIDTWGGQAEMVTQLNDLLLIGSTTGMFIYDVSANPATPEMLSVFTHVEACDPVVGEGKYAYVTLRDGPNQRCGANFSNQLDVINIENPRNPTLVKSFSMTNPHGLGIEDGVLFLADGSAGLRVFDASNPENVGNRELAHFQGMDGYDVILNDGLLILVGKDGIVQYDYNNLNAIEALSTIPVVSK